MQKLKSEQQKYSAELVEDLKQKNDMIVSGLKVRKETRLMGLGTYCGLSMPTKSFKKCKELFRDW